MDHSISRRLKAMVNKTILIGHLGKVPGSKASQKRKRLHVPVDRDEGSVERQGHRGVARTNRLASAWPRGDCSLPDALGSKLGQLLYIRGQAQAVRCRLQDGYNTFKNDVEAYSIKALTPPKSRGGNHGNNREERYPDQTPNPGGYDDDIPF
jgi:hypothetical protein